MPEYFNIFYSFEKGDLALMYEQMYPELIMYASKLLGGEFAFMAKDYVQDAIYKTYSKRGSFYSYTKWKVYLYTCIRTPS